MCIVMVTVIHVHSNGHNIHVHSNGHNTHMHSDGHNIHVHSDSVTTIYVHSEDTIIHGSKRTQHRP